MTQKPAPGFLTQVPIIPNPLALLQQVKHGHLQRRDVEIIAFVRFSAEELTIQQSLESLLPAITKGVLCYHRLPDSATDEQRINLGHSIEIAREFCARNRGFKLVEYPHVVYKAHDENYFMHRLALQRQEAGWKLEEHPDAKFPDAKFLPRECFLDSFYRFTAEHARRLATAAYPYILKVDADHIYDATTIREQQRFLEVAPFAIDFLTVPKFNITYSPTRDKLYFQAVAPVNDHYFIRAEKLTFQMRIDIKHDLEGNVIKPEACAYELTDFKDPVKYDSERFGTLENTLMLRQQILSDFVQYHLRGHGAFLHEFMRHYGYESQGLICYSEEISRQVLHASPEQARKLLNETKMSYYEKCTPTHSALELWNQTPKLNEVQAEEWVQIWRRVANARTRIASLQLEHYNRGVPLQEIPDEFTMPLRVLSYQHGMWINSVHFNNQKHVLKNHPDQCDFTDEQLIELRMIPFEHFIHSELAQDLKLRSLNQQSGMWFLDHERLLNMARQFKYQYWQEHFEKAGKTCYPLLYQAGKLEDAQK